MPNVEKKDLNQQLIDIKEISQTFVNKLNLEKKTISEVIINKYILILSLKLPFIVGYKGFRRGIRSGNFYGKNFKETSLDSKNNIIMNSK